MLMKFRLIFTAILVLEVYGHGQRVPQVRDSQQLSRFRRQDNTKVKFKHRYVTPDVKCLTKEPKKPPFIHVYSTTIVSEKALQKACEIIMLMTKYMPKKIFESVAKGGHGVGIYSALQGKEVFPEYADTKDILECIGTCEGFCESTCDDAGEKWRLTDGVTAELSVINDDNILCTADDLTNGTDNGLVHEFAHQVHLYMPLEYQKRLKLIYQLVMESEIWRDNCYAAENEYEYWAQATSTFFMTSSWIGEDSPFCGMNECNFDRKPCRDEIAARKWLRQQDVEVYKLLSLVYTNKRPWKSSGLKICQ